MALPDSESEGGGGGTDGGEELDPLVRSGSNFVTEKRKRFPGSASQFPHGIVPRTRTDGSAGYRQRAWASIKCCLDKRKVG